MQMEDEATQTVRFLEEKEQRQITAYVEMHLPIVLQETPMLEEMIVN